MNFRPATDLILVRSITKPDVTSGGVFIPENSSGDRHQEVEVIALGPGKIIPETGGVIPIRHQIGDRLLIVKGLGLSIKIDSEQYLLVREPDILGTLTTESSRHESN